MRLLRLLILLCCLSRSAAFLLPKEVRGHIGGSLTVICEYEAELATFRKLWCQGWSGDSCRTLVETNGTEQEMKKDRVTLRDSPRERRFTVTMERLRLNDTGKYYCGIASSISVMYIPVEVYVSQDINSIGGLISTCSKKLAIMATTVTTTTTTASNGPTTSVTLGFSNVTHRSFEARFLLSNFHFLLHVFLEVPLLVGMIGAVVWMSQAWRSPSKCPKSQHSQSMSTEELQH